MTIHKGWLTPATHLPSPNFNARPTDCSIDLLVIHNISIPPNIFYTGYVPDLFLNTLDCTLHPYFSKLVNLQVSAHLLITRDGRLYQFVSFDDRAWHAGRSEFHGRENCNDYSIGIELEGDDLTPFTAPQYRALSTVARQIMQCYPAIAKDRICGHSDIAPGRKTDPGPFFDWQRFRATLL